MICINNPRERVPSTSEQETLEDPSSPRVYDRRFWLSSASNLCTAMAIALLFRYADLVHRLGGGEFELGWIVGTGMVGSIMIRFAMGRTIDRHGARAIWLVSLAVLAAACFAHLLLNTCHGPAIYLLRFVFASAVAGVFGSSITWIGSRAPKERLAEVVGTLGASGFIAWALGNILGDMLSSGPEHVERLFVVAGSFTMVAMIFCWWATAGIVPSPEPSHGSTVRLLWRYSPRIVLLVGAATGLVLGLPSTFLRTFTADLGITTMTAFFGVYAGVALTVRVGARTFPERFGLAPVILAGLLLMGGGLLSFLLVHNAWQLALPAAIMGFAHAVVFPPTVAASTLSFPEHCRGLGTMLILAAYDVGVLVGTPLAGAIVYFSERFGLAPYPTMFVTFAALMGLMSLIFAVSLLRRSHRPSVFTQESPESQETQPRRRTSAPLASYASSALGSAAFDAQVARDANSLIDER
ncbi:MAG TPA: MFS transporter [Thermoguttaceae bacterium]|nr:MFS transporter [Thermoguttaceae bacterium]